MRESGLRTQDEFQGDSRMAYSRMSNQRGGHDNVMIFFCAICARTSYAQTQQATQTEQQLHKTHWINKEGIKTLAHVCPRSSQSSPNKSVIPRGIAAIGGNPAYPGFSACWVDPGIARHCVVESMYPSSMEHSSQLSPPSVPIIKLGNHFIARMRPQPTRHWHYIAYPINPTNYHCQYIPHNEHE